MAAQRTDWMTGTLFSEHYLLERLPESPSWQSVDRDRLRTARRAIETRLAQARPNVDQYTASELEAQLVRPVIHALEHAAAGNAGTTTEDDFDAITFVSAVGGSAPGDESVASDRDDANPCAIVRVAPWDQPLPPMDRGGTNERDPSDASARWTVRTNGRRWRLSRVERGLRPDAFYEIDLPALLAEERLEAFGYFACFFCPSAFETGENVDPFLERVYAESEAFVRETEAALEAQVSEAIVLLARGVLAHPDNHLGVEDLDRIFDSILVYLFRLLVVCYAESNGRELLDRRTERGRSSSILERLEREVATEATTTESGSPPEDPSLWARLEDLFALIDEGSRAQENPEADVRVPAYDGWLFRTEPDQDDPPELRFLADHVVGDAYLSRAIHLLTQREDGEREHPIEYASLDVRRLGTMYEGLLECHLAIAEPSTAEEAGVPMDDDRVYLATDDGDRKATGSYYTPAYVVDHIVTGTLDPLLEEIRTALDDQQWSTDVAYVEAVAARVLDLQVLDPAMGTGHFLTSAAEYLAGAIVDAHARRGIHPAETGMDPEWARSQVVRECLYGVDLDPVAVELATAELWLCTCRSEASTVVGHHFAVGNALIGVTLEEFDTLVDATACDSLGTASNAANARPAGATKQARAGGRQLANGFSRGSSQDDGHSPQLREQRAVVANVETAARFGLDSLPDDWRKRMVSALQNDEEWTALESTAWVRAAQELAEAERFVHWPLAFPDVFDEDSGAVSESPGFDAVIGNPPWRIATDEQRTRYLRETYDRQSGQPDRYRFFIERCLSLMAGRCGMITPNTWLVMDAAEGLRRAVLEPQLLHRASLVPGSAFEGVDANMITFCIDARQETRTIDVWELHDTGEATRCRTIAYRQLDPESYALELQVGREERAIATTMERNAIQLESVADVTTGYQLYHTSMHAPEVIESERYHADRPTTDDHLPEIRGTSLAPFSVDSDPDGFVDASAEFYRRPARRFLAEPKVLIREVTGTDGIVAAQTDRELLFPKSILSLVPTDEGYDPGYLSALLNSDALTFYVRVAGGKSAQELFPRLSVSSINQLPIPHADQPVPRETVARVLAEQPAADGFRSSVTRAAGDASTVAAFLADLADEIAVATQERRRLDPDLFDALEGHLGGPTVDEHDATQRAAGVQETVMADTAADRQDLTLDTLEVDRTSRRLVVRGTAKYKPAHERHRETDQWGYIATESVPLIEVTTADELEATLIATFLEQVVNDAEDGTAGFRARATKTISLLDRVAAIQLPEPTDASHEFDEYLERVARCEELGRRIACARTLIDELVCELYGLSADERTTIREASGPA